MTTIKEKLGCWIHERWKAELAIARLAKTSGLDRNWLLLRNRNERIHVDNVTGGVECCWEHSSKLTVSRIFPSVSQRLLLRLWNVDAAAVLSTVSKVESRKAVSVILPIGGVSRIQQFKAVVDCLLNSTGVKFEIIVIEQSETPSLESLLPKAVRFVHSCADQDAPFNKAKLLNIGAAIASHPVLALHDGDLIVKENYLAQCSDALDHYEVIRPGRFIFYMTKESTGRYFESTKIDSTTVQRFDIEFVAQNTPMPIVIRKESYWRIGGHDESFQGWGGEDVEFHSRCSSLCLSNAGFAPIIHLWHPPAQQKESGHRNHQQQIDKLATPIDRRIEQLVDIAQATYLGNNVKP